MNDKCPLAQKNVSSSLQEQKTQNQLKLKDVEGACHCPLCNKPSVQDVVGCDNCMEWYHLKCLCLTKEPKSKTWFCDYCDS